LLQAAGRSIIPQLQFTAKAEQQEIQTPKIQRINPLAHPDYFNVANMFTVRDLMNARVHFGHKEGSIEDRLKPYFFGKRLGHVIFDLEQTAEYLKRALNFTAHTALQGGIILFFCRSSLNSHIVETTAKECGEFAHTRYWRGGIFTNSNVQFKAVTSELN
jgi:small subunit ribosomal protein S2